MPGPLKHLPQLGKKYGPLVMLLLKKKTFRRETVSSTNAVWAETGLKAASRRKTWGCRMKKIALEKN